jgi:DNA/RNA-binding domain of Phe-tRNA-synthetase-like protein
VRGRYLLITGIDNKKTLPESSRDDELRKVRAWLRANPNWKLTDPILTGFRELHTAIGRSNRDNVAASENLLRLLEKRDSIPRINPVVDLYNLVSLQTRLALGAHDLNKLEGHARLVLTSGNERFLPLGSDELKQIYPDEYAYSDDREIICRLETRQVDKTKVTTDTTDVLYIIQGNQHTSEEYLDAAVERLVELTTTYVGGTAHILPVAPKETGIAG